MPLEAGGLVHYWQLLERLNPEPGEAVRWLCECRCGVRRAVLENNLRRGSTTSCGCVGKRLEGVLSALRAEYRSYLSHARTLGREFTLTEDLFITMMQARCAYCHKRPSRVTGRKRRRGSSEYYHPTAVVGGIDRLDSSRGYSKDNTVPCCARCNNEKKAKTVAEYLQYRFERTVRELCRLVSPHAMIHASTI